MIEKFQMPYKCKEFIKKGDRLLILAPHPDDEVFGCGGVVAKAINEYNVAVKILIISKDSNYKRRYQESINAGNILGYRDINFLAFKDGFIYNDIELLSKELLKIIMQYKPNVVFTPSIWEMHRDHLAITMAYIKALKKVYNNKILTAFYEIGYPLIPNSLYDVTKYYYLKQKAMKQFKSQLIVQNYNYQIEGLNRYRTYTMPKHIKYIEAFYIGNKKEILNLFSKNSIDKFFISLYNSSEFVKNMENRLNLLENENKILKEKNIALENENKILKEKNIALENEVLLYKYSLSYRITKPLRVINRYVRKLTPSFLKIYINKLKNLKFINLYSNNNIISHNRILNNRINYIKKLPISFNLMITKNIELPEIDITLVTFNSEKWIDNYFNSLEKQKFPLNKINIYIVDNGSTDNSIEKLQHIKKNKDYLYKKFKIINSSNIGFGKAHNIAIKKGNSKFILVTNPDLEFEKDTILNIVKIALQDDKKVASWELRQKPYEHPKHYDPVSWECSWSSHATILIRREAFESIKGYDENIFLYGEDVEISYRFRDKGWILRYCPIVTVKHFTYKEKNEIKPQQYIGSIISNIYLRFKYGDFKDKLNALILIVVGCFRKPFKNANILFCKELKNKLFPFLNNFKYKNRKENIFPFRNFDYEMKREGAFYTLPATVKRDIKISVITRTIKGREKYLIQAAYSIFNQTYNNIEWIIVEDGSNEAEKLIDKLKNIHTNIEFKYISIKKSGRSKAGNIGLNAASGEYILFLDDDDLLYSDHLEVLVDALNKNFDAVAAYSLAFMIESDFKNSFLKEKIDYILVKSHFQKFDFEILKNRNYIPIQSILFKRKLFIERGGFDISLDYLEDWNLWVRYAYKNRFVFVPKVTSLYRVPLDNKIKLERQKKLDKAYFEVKKRTQEQLKILKP